MKIWHDDVRSVPDDTWVLARDNDQAQMLLTIAKNSEGTEVENLCTEISLDHDLGADPNNEHGIFAMGHSPDGNGYDLVLWMIENDLVPPKVTIHSWNAGRAKAMAQTLNEAGHDVLISRYVPPSDLG